MREKKRQHKYLRYLCRVYGTDLQGLYDHHREKLTSHLRRELSRIIREQREEEKQ